MADNDFIYKLDSSTSQIPPPPQGGIDNFSSGSQYNPTNNTTNNPTNSSGGLTEDQVLGMIAATIRTLNERMVLATGQIQSQNFLTGVSGWQIDSIGNAEFNNGTFRGVLTASSINIPNSTTASSFHVDTSGNTWWGTNIATGYATAPAYILADGTAKFTSATITGSITATSGSIGGFSIGADYIRDAANSFGLASTVTGGNDVRFWSGDTFANRATAPLRLYEDGSIVGTNATFTGALFATSGWIGSATALVYESQGINTGVTGFIRGGQTSYNTGTGYFLGYDTGAYKLSIGNTTNYLTWDGSKLTVAGTFNIGGTVITINNTQSIQTNLDTINTAGGGTLYLSPGTYTLTSAGLTMYAGVALVGSSPNNTFIDMNSTSGVITIAGTFRYSTGTITSITSGVNVTGSGTLWLANVVAGRDYLFINGQWMIIAAVLTNTTLTLGEGYDGATIGAGSAYRISTPIQGVTLQGFNVKNSTGSAITINDARFLFINNVFEQSNNIGFSANYLTECNVNNMFPVSNVSHGVTVTNGGRYNWNGTNSVSNGGTGIIFTSVRAAAIQESVGNSNTLNGFSETSCTDVTILNYSAEFNGAKGVELVSGNASSVLIDGGIRGNGSDGIKLTASSNKCQIIGGTIENNTGWGVNIANANDNNNTVIGVDFNTNTAGQLTDSGTATKIRGNQGVSDNVVEGDLSLTDITTNDVSATKHGFAPKFPNNTTTFLRGDGTYAAPASSSATAKTMFPFLNSGVNGTTFNTVTGNTTAFVGQIVFPFGMTANKISFDLTSNASPTGTAIISLFSEDGQTRIFSVTTGTLNTAAVISTALSAVAISAGVYYLMIQAVSTLSANCQFFSSSSTTYTDLGTISGKPTIQGTYTVTANTAPSTITLASISWAISSTLVARFDN